MALINLIDKSIIKGIEQDLVNSTVITLKQLDKIVSGATARSIRGETEIDNEEATISIFGGFGLKYIIEGKPANTKYPMKKEGNKFVLVDELRYWKKLVGFQGSDFVLARSIAKNKRDGIDVAGKTIEYFEKAYLPKTTNALLAHTISQAKQAILR
jgi:hypothetical protein